MSTTGILSINLNSIAQNWHVVKSKLAANVDCAAVVKADAYSVGVAKVAPCLYTAGCRTFFAATLAEAIELREILPSSATIFVLGGLSDAPAQTFQAFNLVPVLYSVDDCILWEEFCRSQGAALHCAIKFDTGMSRFGMYLDTFTSWLSLINRAFFAPVLAMSHLACADDPSHTLNCQQLEKFKVIQQSLRAFYPHLKFSLANSSGTFLGDQYHFDMVRIGAALYGINPQVNAANPLQQVIRLSLPILQLKRTHGQVSVGYKAESRVDDGRWLAVVAGGYADGLHRTLSLKPQGLVNNKIVDSVGRISMDSMVFDVSSVVDQIEPTVIEVINDVFTLDHLMARSDTLGYEVLTSLGSRFVRNYIGGANEDLS